MCRSARRTVVDSVEFGKLVTDFFSDQIRGEIYIGISGFIGEPRPLEHPITYAEVERSMNRLNNNQASGSDELPGEIRRKSIGGIFINALTEHQTLSQLGHGVLILLSKASSCNEQSNANLAT